MMRIPPAAGAALVLLAFLYGPALSARTTQAQSHAAGFSQPRVDVLEDGKIVINLEANGADLRGLVTFNLTPNGAGSGTGGWMLAMRYTDNTDPATGIEPPAHDESAEHHDEADHHEEGVAAPHRDYVRFVDKGVIGGTIDSATVSIDAEGHVDFTAALKITIGTLNFTGATGAGTADFTNGLALVY